MHLFIDFYKFSILKKMINPYAKFKKLENKKLKVE